VAQKKQAKQIKIVSRRKKFIEVDLPIVRMKAELIGNNVKDVEGKTIKLDLTRQLKGKSVELTLKVVEENEKLVAIPRKIKLMPYFIRRMIRKRTNYVEDSFTAFTQDSLVRIKPFLITRKKVSKSVRRTLRNLTKNWLEDYFKEKEDIEIFHEILSNRLQKPLSLKLKKTYPLSLCEIRVLEILRPLKPEEVPEKTEKKEEELKELEKEAEQKEEEKIKKAEKEIKETQKKAEEKEKEAEQEEEKIKKAEKETKPEEEKKEEKAESESEKKKEETKEGAKKETKKKKPAKKAEKIEEKKEESKK